MSCGIETLELALAGFPSKLLPAGGAGTLRDAAPLLDGDGTLLFECRLDGRAGPVDLSQQFRAEDGGAARLRALADRCAASLPPDAAAAWERIAAFSRFWEDALPEIVEIWLEHDGSQDGGWETAPAVFAGFAGGVLAAAPAAAAFVDALVPERRASFVRLFGALEAAERAGMKSGRLVGLMLSRGGEMRTMVHGADPGRAPAFLSGIGWPGPSNAVSSVLAEPAVAAVPPVLVLGFDPEPVPGWGLEIFPGEGADPSVLDPVLDWLASRGAAAADRVVAVRGWAGTSTPLDSDAAWPAAMVLRDLTGPCARIEALSRTLGHLKINFEGDRIMAAKAYLALHRVRLGRREPVDA